MSDIRKFIHEKELKAGDVLPSETAFANQLGISRTVAREALRGLAALRILDVGSGRRARVAGPTAEALAVIVEHTVYTKQLSVAQVQDVRRTLEMRTVSLAALHRSDRQALELLELVSGMEEALERDSHRVRDLDIRFHELIAQASGNPIYSVLINSFRIITRQTWDIGWHARGTPENRLENIKCHERIARAITTREAVRAEAAMSEHFDSSFMVLLKAGVN
ncbi:FadR/GntR family transcriptional regulator [Aliiruegeria lutimaris]|uniref:Transcriptional regulator, GntR family n=1 Tax=Aliiruegeria lutimaris TaxID=571298 RepID=A0A1G9HZC9_9RHOB|nr:FCD domain-containing protein [Aliiruegeria lutimaris]SDL18024.1 transcriptional regulator, GntR family [Aliiruegeria lutimaris]